VQKRQESRRIREKLCVRLRFAVEKSSLSPRAVVEGSGREEEARPVRRQMSRLRSAPLDKTREEKRALRSI
jgi:hypothetical protein